VTEQNPSKLSLDEQFIEALKEGDVRGLSLIYGMRFEEALQSLVAEGAITGWERVSADSASGQQEAHFLIKLPDQEMPIAITSTRRNQIRKAKEFPHLPIVYIRHKNEERLSSVDELKGSIWTKIREYKKR